MRYRTILLLLGILIITVLVGCQKKEVVVGAILPESGEAGLIGQALREGIETGLTYIQKDETYPYRLRVEFKDTQSNTDRAEGLFYDLIKDGAVAFIGGVTSSEALKLMKPVSEQQTVLLSPTASHPDLSGKSSYFFRIYPSDLREVAILANFTVKYVKPSSLTVIYQKSDYATGFVQSYTEELKKNAISNVDTLELPPSMDQHDRAVTEALLKKPDAVCIIGYPDALVGLLKDLRNNAYEGTILTTSAVTAPGIMARCGELTRGILFCKPPFTVDENENPLTEYFLKTYEERYGRPPSLLAGYGFDAILVMAEALRSGGYYREDVRKGLIGLQGFSGVTGPTVFNSQGDVNKAYRVFKCLGNIQLDYVKFKDYKRELLRQMIIDLRSGKDGGSGTLTREDLKSYSEDQLRELAKKVGLDSLGTRDELMEKILKALETVDPA
ncbi:MAG TPA: ABC transporter substrate-binding protein [Thermoanaerobaculia bacterium]|nr:ABC transporter substrate-binding protein [Thermoanaerobaculia bacterium]HUM30575.1 ABC transporter substrate-binding protein [Thermoanaerobaculia bacterium]HXK68767.1 ABC transporter substrate-binding protein [Thermoanaerobaculia bacterium]